MSTSVDQWLYWISSVYQDIMYQNLCQLELSAYWYLLDNSQYSINYVSHWCIHLVNRDLLKLMEGASTLRWENLIYTVCQLQQCFTAVIDENGHGTKHKFNSATIHTPQKIKKPFIVKDTFICLVTNISQVFTHFTLDQPKHKAVGYQWKGHWMSSIAPIPFIICYPEQHVISSCFRPLLLRKSILKHYSHAHISLIEN